MGTPAVGEDIEALCGRCGQVWHVVMAKVGERIAKVVCKRCGGHHLYRSEKADAEAPAAPGERRSTTRRFARRTPEPAAPVIPPFDPSKPPRPYSPKDIYAPGERVKHPSFGEGVVASTPGPGKVEVAFGNGLRVLACAKSESTLSRPQHVDAAPIADRPPVK